MIDALTDGKILVLKYFSLPKQYGNQFDLCYCDCFYDYGSNDDQIVFKALPKFNPSYSGASVISSITQITVTCNRQNEWSKKQY